MNSPRRSLSSLATAGIAALAIVALAPAAHAAAESVSDNPTGTPISIDSRAEDRTLAVTTAGVVQDVTVTVDFQVAGWTCDNPQAYSLPAETRLQLISPEGTTVTLVADYYIAGGPSYTSSAAAPRVQSTFDDAAASSIGESPATGTFRPFEPLAAFEGEGAAGTWTLRAQDTVGADPLCYFGATLNLDVETAPVLAPAAFADMRLGEPASAAVEVVPASRAADSFEITAGPLPAGVSLDTATGVISGTPTESGDFVFTVVATNDEGDSDPVEYELRVTAPATLTGDATAQAQAGEAFSYVPDFGPGYPAATEVTLESGELPDGLELDANTGEISGTPVGDLGEYAFTISASNGVGEPATLDVTITLGAGPVAALVLEPAALNVDQGDSVDFTVTAADAFGNPVALAEGDVVLSSDVDSAVIDGLTVTFATAAPHQITATHLETDTTASASVTVAAAPVEPTPVEPTPVAQPGAEVPLADDEVLADTGLRPEYVAQVTAASALLLLGAGLVVARRRADALVPARR